MNVFARPFISIYVYFFFIFDYLIFVCCLHIFLNLFSDFFFVLSFAHSHNSADVCRARCARWCIQFRFQNWNIFAQQEQQEHDEKRYDVVLQKLIHVLSDLVIHTYIFSISISALVIAHAFCASHFVCVFCSLYILLFSDFFLSADYSV